MKTVKRQRYSNDFRDRALVMISLGKPMPGQSNLDTNLPTHPVERQIEYHTPFTKSRNRLRNRSAELEEQTH